MRFEEKQILPAPGRSDPPVSSVESNQGAAPYCVHRLQVVDSIWKVDHRAVGHNRARRVLSQGAPAPALMFLF